MQKKNLIAAILTVMLHSAWGQTLPETALPGNDHLNNHTLPSRSGSQRDTELSDTSGDENRLASSIFSGLITTPNGVGMGNVNVIFKVGGALGLPVSLSGTTSDAQGQFSFNLSSLPALSGFEDLILQKDNDPLNGVDIWDLVLISRHILNIEPLGSPYQLIAADANRSGTVTTYDIVELRKLLLGTYLDLPYNTSWRFVSSQPFDQPDNPFIMLTSDTFHVQNTSEIHCYGIKIGDINQSAVPAQPLADDRHAPALFLTTEDREVVPGAYFDIKMQVGTGAIGYQFQLIGHGITFAEILSSPGLSEEQYRIAPDQNSLTIVAETPLQWITLRCQAHQQGKISEMMNISEGEVPARAYADNGMRLRPTLRFEEHTPVVIYPNPIKEGARLLVTPQNAGKVELIVRDINGKIYWNREYWLEAGQHELPIADLPDSLQGMLIYEITVDGITRSGTFTRIR